MMNSLLRSAILLLLAVAMMFSFVAAPAAAQTQTDFWNSSNRTFYLHLAQYCDRPTALIRWIDEFDWPNDLDGCGGNVLEPTAEWVDSFPLFIPIHANVTAQTTAEMHIFMLSRAVDQTSIEAVFDLGYAKCAGAASPEILTSSRVTGFHEFVIPCTFEVTGAVDPQAVANLTITVRATHTYGYGTEGDHASFVTLSNVVPAPPQEEVKFFEEGQRPLVEFKEEEVQFVELTPASAQARSPGAGFLVTMASVGAVVLVMIRTRRSP